MEWLENNSELVSASATVFMALVWLIYAHIAIVSILRQRRPRVIIDQTEERTLDTKFVVANLSEQPIYINGVMVAVRSGDEEKVKKISIYSHFLSDNDDASPSTIEAELRHGLLNPSEMVLIGGSDRTLSWLLEQGDQEDEEFELPRGQRLRQTLSDIDSFEIRIVATVGIEDKPIASRRTFLIEHNEHDVYIWPEQRQTQHFHSWTDRKRIDEWAEFCLNN